MDMVAGDVAATADETGEEEGKKEAEEANIWRRHRSG
jgi:hypothetical protein